ncbi:unnamed protein product [Calicophoron daubneyi]|uniref:BTB domain-containing protein n=1 Tax=Calicophoron daubneyi TaxID=300641 RepID=A0AAV2TY47_CALDB
MGASLSGMNKNSGCHSFGVWNSLRTNRQDSSGEPSHGRSRFVCGPCGQGSSQKSSQGFCRLANLTNIEYSSDARSATITDRTSVPTDAQTEPLQAAHGFVYTRVHSIPGEESFLSMHGPQVSRRRSQEYGEMSVPVILKEPRRKPSLRVEGPAGQSSANGPLDASVCWKHNTSFANHLQDILNIAVCSNVYRAQFFDLIRSCSYEELRNLHLQYESLIHLESMLEDAVNARPRASTLDEDLRLLCANGWCSDLQLSYCGSTHAAHSYILATRSNAFADVLSPVYGLQANSGLGSQAVPNLTVVLPRCAEGQPCDAAATQTHGALNESKKALNQHNSPDVLPSRSLNIIEHKLLLSSKGVKKDISHGDNLNPTKMINPPKSVPECDCEYGFEAFLFELYSGFNRANNASMRIPLGNPKPDLLCKSDTHNMAWPSSLVRLYRCLKTNQTGTPFSADCLLSFQYDPPDASGTLDVPCHAGILAARSSFLRRLLLRRYRRVNPKTLGLTKIVLDGKLLRPHFAHILLYFFYTDRLNLSHIASLSSSFSNRGSSSCIPTSYADSVSELHWFWHQEHMRFSSDEVLCCTRTRHRDVISESVGGVLGKIPTDSGSGVTERNMGEYSGQGREKPGLNHQCFTRLPETARQQRRKLRFCLVCPFCLAHILELHPVGQYLEFPRLSEACEDVLVKALRLSRPITTSRPSSNCNAFPQVTTVSLAVGLLNWAENRSSKSNADRIPERQTDCMSSEHPLSGTPSVQNNSTPTGPHSPNITCGCRTQRQASDSSFHQLLSSDNTGTVTSYIYRQALHCLRRNFMSLVRSPSVLSRLAADQLRELLSSHIIEAPESEILAALLCWAELHLKRTTYKRATDPKDSRSVKTNADASSEYLHLVSSLTEHSFLVRKESVLCPDVNPWLFLGLNDEETTSAINSLSLAPLKSQHQILADHLSKSSSLTIGHHKFVSTMDPNRTSTDVSFSQSNTVINGQQVACKLGFETVDLNTIVRVLHEHNLLAQLRPAYLLQSVPLELAASILQNEIGTNAGGYNILNNEHLSVGNLDDSHAQHSSKQFLSGSSSGYYPLSSPSKSDKLPQWLPLLNTSMTILPPFPNKKGDSFAPIHPWLSAKLGCGPLTNCPRISPAKMTAKLSWFRPAPTNAQSPVDLLRELFPCQCRWAINRSNNVDGSTEQDGNTQLLGQTTVETTADFWSPRLFHPFAEEVQKIIAGIRAANFDIVPSKSVLEDPTDTPGELRCTCPKFLSALTNYYSKSSFAAPSHPDFESKKTPVHKADPEQSLKCDQLEDSFFDRHETCVPRHFRYSPSPQRRQFGQSYSSPCTPKLTSKLEKKMRNRSSTISRENLGLSPQSCCCCCKPECLAVAHCLLKPEQWRLLVDRYFALVTHFQAGISDRCPYAKPRLVSHLFCLQALRELSLPDSLEPILMCRINERVYQEQEHHHQQQQQEENEAEHCSSNKTTCSQCAAVTNGPDPDLTHQEALALNPSHTAKTSCSNSGNRRCKATQPDPKVRMDLYNEETRSIDKQIHENSVRNSQPCLAENGLNGNSNHGPSPLNSKSYANVPYCLVCSFNSYGDVKLPLKIPEKSMIEVSALDELETETDTAYFESCYTCHELPETDSSGEMCSCFTSLPNYCPHLFVNPLPCDSPYPVLLTAPRKPASHQRKKHARLHVPLLLYRTSTKKKEDKPQCSVIGTNILDQKVHWDNGSLGKTLFSSHSRHAKFKGSRKYLYSIPDSSCEFCTDLDTSAFLQPVDCCHPTDLQSDYVFPSCKNVGVVPDDMAVRRQNATHMLSTSAMPSAPDLPYSPLPQSSISSPMVSSQSSYQSSCLSSLSRSLSDASEILSSTDSLLPPQLTADT